MLMAEMKINIKPIVDKVLDETQYAGRTFREWIAEIERQEHTVKGYAYCLWNIQGDDWRCPSCDTSYNVRQFGEEIFRFCPKCGIVLKVHDDDPMEWENIM